MIRIEVGHSSDVDDSELANLISELNRICNEYEADLSTYIDDLKREQDNER